MTTLEPDHDLLAHNTPCHASANPVWLLWSCDDIVGSYRTERDAQEARADLQHQLLCEYGANVELLEGMTISPACVASRSFGMDMSPR